MTSVLSLYLVYTVFRMHPHIHYTLIFLLRVISVRPEKFQFLEKGQNRNFDYKNCNFDQKSRIYSLDLG